MFTSSREALTRFLAQPDAYDAIISDQTMPDLTGDELVREVRALRPDVPVIVCSGYSDRLDAEQARSCGCEDFLLKPIALGDLIRAVDSLF